MKISGVIGSWEADPSDIVAEIESQNGDFTIELDSAGGSVMGGITIANAMRDHEGDITVIIGARSASIASYFMMFAKKIIARDNSTVMIHNAWLPAIGDFNALRKSADLSEGLSRVMNNAYSDRTGVDKEELQGLMNEETYYYGSEIVEFGLADELKDTEDEKDRIAAVSVAMESVKACNNSVLKNEKLDYEAVAELIPNKEDEILKAQQLEDEKKEEKRLADLNAKQKRDRQLSILTKRK